MAGEWLNGPVGRGAEHRVLRHGCRTVLVVVPFLVAGTRLMDVLPLLESDHRVLVVFSVAPAPNRAICHGTEEFLRMNSCLVLPWEQAVQHEFDLVLAASAHGLVEVHGKSLLVPHGAGAVRPLLRSRSAGAVAAPTHALDREALMSRGRVVPHVLALSHDAELDVLRTSCPEALPSAAVVGDVCYDRLLASIPFRARYREAFGVARTDRLVVVSSTWQPESTLGSQPDLVDRLLCSLPRRGYRVAAVVHPTVWSVHGHWQVRTWFADCLRAGLVLLPPDEGWRAALVAADLVIGDHGSVTRYGAAIGLPVITTALPADRLRPGGAMALLARHAPRLLADRPLRRQVDVAMAAERGWQGGVSAHLTSHPGRAGERLRAAMYAVLGIAEPDRAVPCSPVPLPRPVACEASWWLDGRDV
jgi:hypothetical protein